MHQPYSKPFLIFFLVLPAGISIGFATVTLPYLLTQNGFSVEKAAAITAIGVSANLWRFLWGPVADLTLSLRKWYWIGVIFCTTSLLLLCYTPFTLKGEVLLKAIVFISQVAATLILLPAGGFMAHCIAEEKKSIAAGWFQAGNLGGVGLGGGAGLWFATHYSVSIAGIVLCIISILFAVAVMFIKDVKYEKEKTIAVAITSMGKDLLSMLKIPVALFVIILICMPIGSGAAANLWSAIAIDWHVNVDTVALVTGILSGGISALGCVIGGFIADKYGVWIAYLGSGTVCAIVTIAMAALPYEPYVYISGVLAYTFALGLLNAAFSSVLLFAIGKKNAATKYSLLSSLGNLPVVYMTTFDGWTHDQHKSKYMLVAEGVAGIAFVLLCVVILKWMKEKKWLHKPVDLTETVYA